MLEGGVGERQMMEVGLLQAAVAVQTCLGAQHIAAVNLVLVERHARHARAGKAPNVAQRPSDAASAVEDVVRGLDAET